MFGRIRPILYSLLGLLSIAESGFALWVSIPSLTTTLRDQRMSPYLCAADGDHTLWFITSSASGYGSYNGVFKLTRGDTVATDVDEFPVGSFITELTGIAILGGDVFVSAKTAGGGSYIIKYKSGMKEARELYPKDGQLGYETTFYGIDISTGGYLFAGVLTSQGSSIRVFDFTGKGRDGTEILPRSDGRTPNGFIRDISVVPGRDYEAPGNFILSSRASGGVCKWGGGTSLDPSRYSPESDLVLTGPYSPYGITLDPPGNFFLCNSGGGAVWVRFFNGAGNLLESVPDPGFEAPSDVARTRSGDFLYVLDEKARKIFLFESPISVTPLSWGRLKAFFRY